MRAIAAVILGSVLCISIADAQSVGRGNGQPARFLASCEADLTGDKQADLVLLVETVRGTELIALVSTGVGAYSTFVLSRERPGGILSCPLGPEVRETRAGRGSGRVIRTPGAYVHLVWPEASSVAYVWSAGKFLEVWTSD